MELHPKRREALKRVFVRFDFNGDGFLDVKDMQVLGWALSVRQRVPELHEASLQIQRADRDGDGLLSEEEFLRYSVVLGRLPDHDFVLLVRLLEESHAHALKSGLIAALHMTPVLAAAPAAAGAAAGAP